MSGVAGFLVRAATLPRRSREEGGAGGSRKGGSEGDLPPPRCLALPLGLPRRRLSGGASTSGLLPVGGHSRELCGSEGSRRGRRRRGEGRGVERSQKGLYLGLLIQAWASGGGGWALRSRSRITTPTRSRSRITSARTRMFPSLFFLLRGKEPMSLWVGT